MTLTEREQNLLLRALDKASAAAEADKAAQALIASLRKRGISGYDFLDRSKGTHTTPRKPASTPSPPPAPKPAKPAKPKESAPRSQHQKYAWEGWSRENYKKPVPSREFSVDLFTVVATPLAVVGGVALLFFATALAIGSPILGIPLLAFLIFRCYSHLTILEAQARQNVMNDQRRNRG